MQQLPQDLTVKIGQYQFSRRHLLGEGAYSRVYEGRDSLSGQPVAIKQIDKRLFREDPYVLQQIQLETQILKRFRHANILQFYDFIESANNCYLVTEICRDGDLQSYLRAHRPTEREALLIMRQLVDGFRELVKQNVVHRDLKPANVLRDGGVFKIADFGFSRMVDFQAQLAVLMKSCVGTPYYMSPQILFGQPYTIKSDIWSLGVIFYEILTGQLPYVASTQQELQLKIRTTQVNLARIQSPFLADVVRRCLVQDEEQRISWSELFRLFDAADERSAECGGTQR